MNSTRPRIGVMGGTFDPVHFGHLSAASEVADQLDLDEVVFVPTGQPWQKAEQSVSDAEDRYAMTVLATSAHPRFRVSRVDIDRHGETYTVDTLRDLYEWYDADVELYFITGADTLANVNSWKSVDDVFQLATFVVVNRPGYRQADFDLPLNAAVVAVSISGMDISATECRKRVAHGRSVWYLMPDDVVRYIASRGLYRQAAGQ